MDMAPGRRWRYVPPELVAVIALQLAGAGAGVAAALAAGRAGPARAAGGAVAGVAGQQQAGVRWLVLAGAVVLVLAVLVAAWWLIGDRYSSLSPGAECLIRPFPVSPAAERAAGRGSVLAAIVAAGWLTWASLRHGLRPSLVVGAGPAAAGGNPGRLHLAGIYRAGRRGPYRYRVRDLVRVPRPRGPARVGRNPFTHPAVVSAVPHRRDARQRCLRCASAVWLGGEPFLECRPG